MSKRASEHPTGAELEILTVLWRRGPSTVREVHEVLQAQKNTTITTTLKMLQVMTGKGLVLQDGARPHRYIAAMPQEQAQAGLVQDLARRAFDGSVGKLLVRAVSDGDLGIDELRKIRRLLDRAQRGKGAGK